MNTTTATAPKFRRVMNGWYASNNEAEGFGIVILAQENNTKAWGYTVRNDSTGQEFTGSANTLPNAKAGATALAHQVIG